MKKITRKELISKLEIMQGNGEFEGYPENEMDFNKLENDDLFYYTEWINSDN